MERAAALGVDPEELGAGEDGMPNDAFQRARAMQIQLQREAHRRRN